MRFEFSADHSDDTDGDVCVKISKNGNIYDISTGDSIPIFGRKNVSFPTEGIPTLTKMDTLVLQVGG
jgi:hypothetical protein